MRARSLQRCTGFTYLGLLFFVAIMGAGLVAVAQVWHTQVQRDKEVELLFVGNQFRRAIGQYYERAPGGGRQYPKRLEDLVQDQRFPNVQRYLRRIYADPMTGKAEWGLVKAPDGSILGVHSLSQEAPLKVAGFSTADAAFADSLSYREWKFVYLPATQGAGQPGAPGTPGAAPGTQPPGVPGRGPGAQLTTDPGLAQGLDMAAREAGCRAQRARELEACGQDPASSKDCVSAAATRYSTCLGAGSSQ
jgi:type II secretory pathway pseudopilin PulG